MADARPGQNAKHDHDEVHTLFDRDARTDDGGKNHRKRKERQTADDLGDTHDDVVDPAAEITGQTAEDDADDKLDNNRDGADGHGDLAAVDEAVKHVAAQIVRTAEIALQAPRLDVAVDRDGIVLIEAREDRHDLLIVEGCRDGCLTMGIVAPGDDLAVVHQSREVVAAAVEFDRLALKCRNVFFAVGAGAPDDDGAVFLDRRDRVAGRCNVNDTGIQSVRDADEGVILLETRVDSCAVFGQGDIPASGQSDFFDVALIFLFDLDIGLIAVAPEEQFTVFGDSRGELVAGLDLLDAEVLAVGGGHLDLVGNAVLPKAFVAPDIDRAVFVERDDMVIACRDVDDLGLTHLVGDVLQIDGIGDLGVAPDIDVAVGIRADAVGRAGRDICDLMLHTVGNGHHVHSGRDVQLGVVLIGQVERIEIRADHDQQENQKEHDQADHAKLVMQEILEDQAAGALQLFFRHEVGDLVAVAEQAGKEGRFFLFFHISFFPPLTY